ncbi:sulfatase [Aureococcus anophagefferens]|nr:sulfatase [Aureococcus anophagefferens]
MRAILAACCVAGAGAAPPPVHRYVSKLKGNGTKKMNLLTMIDPDKPAPAAGARDHPRAPSRAALLTGRAVFDAYNFGSVRAVPTFTRHVSLPEKLRLAGYATTAVGKWHADVNSYNHGFEYGRAVLFRPMGSTHFARAKARNESFGPLPLVDVDPGEKLCGTQIFNPTSMCAYSKSKKFRASKFKKVGQEAAVLRACMPRSRFLPRCHSSALFAEAGSRELARWRRSRLTGFLYVALTAPHDPLEPLDRDVADATAGPPASVRDRHARRRLYGGLVASSARRRASAASRPDRILVVTSDHGIALDGRHGLIGKQNLYEHSNKRMVVDTATNLKVIAHFNSSLKGRGDTARAHRGQGDGVSRDPDELDDLVLRDFESNAAAAAHYAPRLPAAGDDAVGALLREAQGRGRAQARRTGRRRRHAAAVGGAARARGPGLRFAPRPR